MTMPSASPLSKIEWIFRTRSSQSLSTSAWLGKRRNGISCTLAIVLSSGSWLRSSPSLRRLFASMYQARSSRSMPTESIVPPVRINPTLAKLVIATRLLLSKTFSAYGPAFPRCQLDRFENLRVSGAAAEVTTQIMCDGFLIRIRMLVEQFSNHHDEARRAIAALKGAGLDKSLLHRAQFIRCFETLNSGHRRAIDKCCKVKTTRDRIVIDDDRTAAA